MKFSVRQIFENILIKRISCGLLPFINQSRDVMAKVRAGNDFIWITKSFKYKSYQQRL